MAKGGAFEREVSVLLSKWWTGGKKEDVFYRSTSSGARFTARFKRGKQTSDHHGDICSIDVCGKPFTDTFSSELKTGYSGRRKEKTGKVSIINWCVLDILDSRQALPVLLKMWEQSARDAERAGKIPLLIFRRPMLSPNITMEERVFLSLGAHFDNVPQKRIMVHTEEYSLAVFSLKDFFSWVDGEALCCLLNEKNIVF